MKRILCTMLLAVLAFFMAPMSAEASQLMVTDASHATPVVSQLNPSADSELLDEEIIIIIIKDDDKGTRLVIIVIDIE